jgi:hypothetical protein
VDSERIAGGAYHAGTDFLAAADRLEAGFGAGEPEQLRPMSPAIVCRAFAIELFFKSILALGGARAKGYNLTALVEMLDDAAKGRLRGELNCTEDTFRCRLARIESSFVDWRYSHEGGALSIELSFIRGLCTASMAEAELHFAPRRLLPIHASAA